MTDYFILWLMGVICGVVGTFIGAFVYVNYVGF